MFSRPLSGRQTHWASAIGALVTVALLVGAPGTATAQRTTTDAAKRSAAQLSGQMLPLQPLPQGMMPAVTATMNRVRMSVCKPSQPGGGPGPSSFLSGVPLPSGVAFEWPAVAGAVAYLVERAVDGTSNWIVAASTCGGPDSIREYEYSRGVYRVFFQDIAGGIKPGESYVYKVTAIDGAGAVGWNSLRFAPLPYVPTLAAIAISGSTVQFTAVQPCMIFALMPGAAEEVAITTSYGLNRIVSTSGGCQTPVVVYGVPEGTHTFTVEARWTQRLDPNMPRVVGVSSGSTTITIKP